MRCSNELRILDERLPELADAIGEHDLAIVTRARTEASHFLQVHDETRAARPADPQAGARALAVATTQLEGAHGLTLLRLDLLRPWWVKARHPRRWQAQRRQVRQILDEDAEDQAEYQADVQRRAEELSAADQDRPR